MIDRRFFSAPLFVTVVALLLGVTTVTGAMAQERDTIPRNSDAELMFEQGLTAFEQESYETAYKRFELVTDYDLNRVTTAAMLMEGKALLRMGRYQEAIDRLETLLDRYPETSYQEQAERAIDVAQQSLQEEGRQADTLRVGVVLPMGEDQVSLSQALFNGIRLAVDEQNGVRRRFLSPAGLPASADSFDVYDTAEAYSDSLSEAEGATTVATPTDTLQVDSLRVVTEQVQRTEWVAKMYFRQFESGGEGARIAVDSLVRQDEVDVILGPLYSQEARAAGERAEQAQVPLVAPLATDESVSEGREYVFQTNPTMPVRGRLMARFASESLLTESAGIIYEQGSRIINQMREGFREGAEEADMEVPFALQLDNSRDWSRLPEAIEEDTTFSDSLLAEAEAFYVPISGRNASGKIQDALTGLDRLALDTRILGNSNWHNLSVKQEASKFTTTYTNDFYVQTERQEVQAFIRRYRMLTGDTPDQLSVTGRRLAYTGYDVARFLLTTLSPTEDFALSGRPPQAEAIRTAPEYDGLGLRIHFQGSNVNEAMFFHRYRNERLELLR